METNRLIIRRYSENDLNDLYEYLSDEDVVRFEPYKARWFVESGCYGTFPLLLCILDDRVDFKMFTTVPYLLNIYGDRIYTKEYEKNRLFETLYSQDKLFKFDSYLGNKYYVLINDSDELNNKALAEIKRII